MKIQDGFFRKKPQNINKHSCCCFKSLALNIYFSIILLPQKKKILIILCVNYTIGMGLPVPSHPQACAGKVRMIVSNIITVIRIQNNSNSLIQDNML